MRNYEVEDKTEYYNSYTDKIITGSMLPDGKRGQVGSVVSGSWEWEGETHFSPYLFKLNNPFFRSGMVNCTFASEKDTFFNSSIPPDFRDIYQMNDGKFIAPKYDEVVVGTAPTPQPFETKLLKILLSVSGTLTGSDGKQLSDNSWWYEYPFSFKYNGVRRLPNVSKAASTASYEEVSLGGLIHYQPVTEPTSSNNYVVCISLGSNAVGSTVIWLNSYDKVGTVNPSTGLFNFATAKTSGLGEKDFTTIYFGHKPKYVYAISTVILGQGIYGYNFGIKTRGFKYGLMNGTPVQPKTAWSRSHFGFRSDMLEQGLTSTTWNEKTGQLYKPVTVQFVSGSRSAFSASNPSLNSTGSGLYDYEYRVGIPFAEVI